MTRPALITTSWDDGHPLDLRLAELLCRYGATGTFYIPTHYSGIARMSRAELVTLRGMGMELGSHTRTHPRMHRLPAQAVLSELRDSKAYLEDLLGEEVRAFCYPEGKFTARLVPYIVQAGYQLARTSLAFHTSFDFDPRLMPVGLQFWRHSRHVLLRHALLEANFRGAANWIRYWGAEHRPGKLAQSMLAHVERAGGVVHLWGHSWELEKAGLWRELDETLRRFTQNGPVRFGTNSDVAKLSTHAKPELNSVYA